MKAFLNGGIIAVFTPLPFITEAYAQQNNNFEFGNFDQDFDSALGHAQTIGQNLLSNPLARIGILYIYTQFYYEWMQYYDNYDRDSYDSFIASNATLRDSILFMQYQILHLSVPRTVGDDMRSAYRINQNEYNNLYSQLQNESSLFSYVSPNDYLGYLSIYISLMYQIDNVNWARHCFNGGFFSLCGCGIFPFCRSGDSELPVQSVELWDPRTVTGTADVSVLRDKRCALRRVINS